MTLVIVNLTFLLGLSVFLSFAPSLFLLRMGGTPKQAITLNPYHKPTPLLSMGPLSSYRIPRLFRGGLYLTGGIPVSRRVRTLHTAHPPCHPRARGDPVLRFVRIWPFHSIVGPTLMVALFEPRRGSICLAPGETRGSDVV